jgi:hypothetical protein
MDSRHFPIASLSHKVGNDAWLITFPLVANVDERRKWQMKSVIPGLVSDRRERRVSGIHARSNMKPEAFQKECA